MSEPHFVQKQLANGLTVVIEVMPHVPSAACGFLARTGSRDDPAGMAGVSHFLEHMCFKGTQRRSWDQISIDFDEMGAHYNAYTSKDRTFYYGWVRAEDIARQMELLADMMRPTLPEDQFDMEKKVVLEEVAMSNDDLTSVAYDFLYEQLCPNSPLSWPVLGYANTLDSMSCGQMKDYCRQRYAPGNLILIVAGNVNPDFVLATADRLCGHWPAVDPGSDRRAPTMQTGSAVRSTDRFYQQAILLAYPAADARNAHNETAEAVAAILGGNNSRFYWNIMQQGLSTRAGVFREEYADFALMILYALCEPDKAEQVLEAMRREVKSLTDNGPEAKEVQRVKNLRRTSLAVESEAPFYRLGQIADDVDYRGRPRAAADRLAEVEAVSAERIADYLNAFPMTGEGFLVSAGPRQWP